MARQSWGFERYSIGSYGLCFARPRYLRSTMTSYATLYNPVPSMLGSRLLDHLDHVREYKEISNGSSAMGFFVKLDSGSTIQMNYSSSADLASRLDGFMGFARESISDKDRLIYALSRIRDTRLMIGCVIEPGLDPESEDNDQQAVDFLFEINSHLSGLLFINDAIFDYDAECLTDEESE